MKDLRHTARRTALISLACISVALITPGSADANDLTVNPDTGMLSVNASPFAWTVVWKGRTITNGGIGPDGAREYLVRGNFIVDADDTVTAVLSSSLYAQRPVRFIVGNDAVLAGTFEFSAVGQLHRAGGGIGGMAASGGGSGGTWGGAGGYGSVAPMGGRGGSGGLWPGLSGNDGRDPRHASPGQDGNNGGAGYMGGVGWSGGAGGPGYNAAASGGDGGDGGNRGGGGTSGDGGLGGAGGTGGSGGSGRGYGIGGNGGNGGERGQGGDHGHAGGFGYPGGDAEPGTHGTTLTGTWTLSGGGGGGTAVGEGGAGGYGGIGGKGGNGGNGSRGGVGGHGGWGGQGGAGGGAFEIRVNGMTTLQNAYFLALGAPRVEGREGVSGSSPGPWEPGETGFDGTAGDPGENGGGGSGGSGGIYWNNGDDGSDGSDDLFDGGAGGGGGGGGAGGYGDRGAWGGRGGDGGDGGDGAGGGGGTVRLISSALEGVALVDTAGGDTLDLNYDPGYDGRFVLGWNTADDFGGYALDTQLITMYDTLARHRGTRDENPHVQPMMTPPQIDARSEIGPVETPYIPGLPGGAEVFGLTTLSSTDNDLLPFLADCPPDAVAALVLMDEGPASLAQNWDGFDMLLMLNLTDNALSHPKLGVGSEGYLADLMTGGFAVSTLFGGPGPKVLGELPAHGVYATLVPENANHFNMIADGCRFAYGDSLRHGEALYMVPEPATVTMLILGGAGLLACRRRRRRRR